MGIYCKKAKLDEILQLCSTIYLYLSGNVRRAWATQRLNISFRDKTVQMGSDEKFGFGSFLVSSKANRQLVYVGLKLMQVVVPVGVSKYFHR